MSYRVLHAARAATLAGIIGFAFGAGAASPAAAQGGLEVTGQMEWGLWVDPDGCMHWYSDGGLEGYMVSRRDPASGKHMCLEKNTCAVENSDALFATDSAQLTAAGRSRLYAFFREADAFGYAIYGHTDSRASDEYNMALSQRRANAVARVAAEAGAIVDRVIGVGERYPLVANSSAANMQKNRRVEIVCYRYPS